MSYNIEVIRNDEHLTSNWSGGTTTQLLIYPKDSLYSERNFKWRISSAKVDLEESTFTYLPGFSRIIMIIDGEMVLDHENHHKVKLKEFEQDSFKGDWTTKSFGKVVDFNLMMNEDCHGSLDVITIGGNDSKNIIINGEKTKKNYNNITEAFYCISGEIDIELEMNNKLTMSQGDLISITDKQKDNEYKLKFLNKTNEEAKFIKVKVYY